MNELLALLLPSNEAKMSTTVDHNSCFNGNSPSLEQAKGIQANSSGQFPSFLKQLLKSHLSGKFYLGLPKKFCDAHMPARDETIVLVDENEKEYSMKYSVRKNRLGSGWRIFSIAHKLLEGDALLFHLIEPCKFKVYIMRASKLTENEGVVAIHTHDFPNIRPISSVKMEAQMDETASASLTTRHIPINPRDPKKPRITEIELSDSSVPEATKGPSDFKIQMDGLILDRDIPSNLMTKYYNLCCTQKRALHDCLIKCISSKLAVAIICETINISDAIRSADLATPIHCLDGWDTTLKAFEDLGMAVGFLRVRVQKLADLKREHQVMSSSVRALVGQVEARVEALEWEDKKLCYEFQMLARAPW